MATTNNKTSPNFSKAKSFSDWIRLIRLWTKFTDLDPTRQVPSLVNDTRMEKDWTPS